MESSTARRQNGQPAPDHTAEAERQAGLYAFGVLEGLELARFERHLAACGRCAEVVAGDTAIVSALTLTAPEVEPTPGFKERLLARAAAEESSRRGVGGHGGGAVVPLQVPPERRTGLARLSWIVGLAAVLLALIAGAGLLSREIESAQIVAAAPLENRTEQGRAELLIRRSGEGVIQLSGFEDLRDGRVYQAWVIRPNSQPVATGASTRGNGTLILEGDVRGARVAVTLEPGPGAQAPSTPPFLVGEAPA